MSIYVCTLPQTHLENHPVLVPKTIPGAQSPPRQFPDTKNDKQTPLHRPQIMGQIDICCYRKSTLNPMN